MNKDEIISIPGTVLREDETTVQYKRRIDDIMPTPIRVNAGHTAMKTERTALVNNLIFLEDTGYAKLQDINDGEDIPFIVMMSRKSFIEGFVKLLTDSNTLAEL
jgi:hypothetical protein